MPLLNITQISNHYNVPESFIRLLVECGKIPFYGDKEAPEFNLNEVKDFLMLEKAKEFNRLSELF